MTTLTPKPPVCKCCANAPAGPDGLCEVCRKAMEKAEPFAFETEKPAPLPPTFSAEERELIRRIMGGGRP